MKTRNVLELIGTIVLCQLAGLLGAVFTTPAIPTWYASLTKPFFTPPSWVFGPVWITLYTLMGISLYLIWKSKKDNKLVLKLFGAQLALNALWSILFFGMQNPLLGLIDILVLWVVLAATIVKSYKIDKRAAWLLIPYILWGTLATLLNLAIFLLN